MMIKKEFRDIFGRPVGVDDILVYCSPFDGLHLLYITLEDPDGSLYVSKMKTDGLNDGSEWLNAFDDPDIPGIVEDETGEKRDSGLENLILVAGTIKNIKLSRRCFPITLYKDYVALKKLSREEKLNNLILSKIC